MRVVLDTNVLVSSQLSPNGSPAEVLHFVLEKHAVPVLDHRILTEYYDVLLRPKLHIPRQQVLDLLEDLVAVSAMLPVGSDRVDLPDPTDAKFVECALAGGADYLVTGNLRHFPAEACRGVRVASPAEFVAIAK